MGESKTSRHGVLADDSSRVCVILPKSVKDDVDAIASSTKRRSSDVIREYVMAGVRRDRK